MFIVFILFVMRLFTITILSNPQSCAYYQYQQLNKPNELQQQAMLVT